MNPERSFGENSLYHQYQAHIRTLDRKFHLRPTDVRELLLLKQAFLESRQDTNELTHIGFAINRWEYGNRVTAFEYVLQEAFLVDPTEYNAYKSNASFWLKCASALMREPLCPSPNVYGIMREHMEQRYPDDPQLYGTIIAALNLNEAVYTGNIEKATLQEFTNQYANTRYELFGPLVAPLKD